jgi:hypothetical protein
MLAEQVRDSGTLANNSAELGAISDLVVAGGGVGGLEGPAAVPVHVQVAGGGRLAPAYRVGVVRAGQLGVVIDLPVGQGARPAVDHQPGLAQKDLVMVYHGLVGDAHRGPHLERRRACGRCDYPEVEDRPGCGLVNARVEAHGVGVAGPSFYRPGNTFLAHITVERG